MESKIPSEIPVVPSGKGSPKNIDKYEVIPGDRKSKRKLRCVLCESVLLSRNRVTHERSKKHQDSLAGKPKQKTTRIEQTRKASLSYYYRNRKTILKKCREKYNEKKIRETGNPARKNGKAEDETEKTTVII